MTTAIDRTTTATDVLPLRVLVGHHLGIVRAGLAALLATADGLDVVGSAAGARDLRHRVANARPDLVVAGAAVLDDHRGLARPLGLDRPTVPVVVVADTLADVLPAVRAGARGVVLADAEAGEVVDVVRLAAAGGLGLGTAPAAHLTALVADLPPGPPRAFPALTDRERETLDGLAAGWSNHEIARAGFVSPKTVRNVVSALYAKLQVTSRAEAVVLAREAGLGRHGDDARVVRIDRPDRETRRAATLVGVPA